jgi:hypothetical protein
MNKKLLVSVCVMIITVFLSMNVMAAQTVADSPPLSMDNIFDPLKEDVNAIPAGENEKINQKLITPIPGDGINEAYTLPTKEQIEQEAAKSKLAEEYVAKKKATKGAGGSKVNSVGTFKQSQTWTCGPTSARNLINGYLYWNYTRLGLPCTIPEESTLGSSTWLNTQTNGTEFNATRWPNTLNNFAPGHSYTLVWGSGTDSQWNSSVATKVIATIDQANNYNVIGNLNHGITTTPIHPVYSNGAVHYICIHGYNDSNQTYNIADSKQGIATLYTTPYLNLSKSVKARGIIW